MWLEWGLPDAWRIALVTLAAAAAVLLAARFVYRGAPRGLWLLRAGIVALWWVGVVSLALVVRREETVRPVRLAYVDVSESMQTRDESLEGSPVARAQAAEALAAELEKHEGGILVRFAAGLDAADRGTTMLAPVLQDTLRRALATEGSLRAVVISDGGAADEPALAPLLSALAQQGVSVDVAPLGRAPDPAQRVGVALAGEPPAMMVSGETTWIDLTVSGSGVSRMSILQSGRALASLENIPPGRSRVAVVPARAGRHPFEIVSERGGRSARVGFQSLVLPPLKVGFSGPVSWDMWMARRAVGAAAGIRAEAAGPHGRPRAAQLIVISGPEQDIPGGRPVTFWPQEQMKGESRGIRWIGFEPGTHAVVRSGAQRPLSARHTVVLDPTWSVKERYPDGMPFIAEREHPGEPAYLVNGIGLWRWGFDATAAGRRSTEQERRVDAWLDWCRRQIWPAADVYPSRTQVMRGEPVELFAVFKNTPEQAVVFEIHQPDGSVIKRPAPPARLVKTVFLPTSDGAYTVRIAGVSGAESGFATRTIDYDRVYPDANRDVLLKIAQATGGSVLTAREALESSNTSEPADERVMRTRRYRLARQPLAFILVLVLLSGLWMMESRWFR